MKFLFMPMIVAALSLVPVSAPAHSGGLNSQGCHAGSQPYHCHRSPSDMVGNRLKCELGSRSKECSKPAEKSDTTTSSSSEDTSETPE